jgi:N-acetylglucosaminyl-diphospho-decaprenol L-rhamnosyltransferase
VTGDDASDAQVDVCIISFDAGSMIDACVRSLAKIPGARLRLREHSDRAASLDIARAAASAIGIAVDDSHDAANPGFATGMNDLASGATAPWLLFLNPDAEVLTWPWNASAPPPTGTVIGAEQVSSSGADQRAYGRRFGVADEVARSWLRRVPEPRHGEGFVGGAGLLIERGAFQRLGGFDERYFLFYEDIDLCVRATAAGMGVVLDRRFRIRHDTGSSTRRRWDAALGHSYRSGRIFHRGHGHSLRAYDAFVAADSAARAALWAARRDADRRQAYSRLARRAARLLLRRAEPSDDLPGWPSTAP